MLKGGADAYDQRHAAVAPDAVSPSASGPASNRGMKADRAKAMRNPHPRIELGFV